MKLLAPSAWNKITAIAKSVKEPAFVAVAYFSARGDVLLPLRKGSVLVVDASIRTVSAGGTCPAALLRMAKRGVQIYSVQNLHAKLFVFGKSVFVGSTNASTMSERYLVEAVAHFESVKFAAQASAFVRGLAVTVLSEQDLEELDKAYKPPKPPKFPKKQSATSTLLMELKKEQGEGRETQVQPPRPVWETYFGLDFDNGPYPDLVLINECVAPPEKLKRKIVKHHHNLTIEIAGAEMPRPAILEIRGIGRNIYSYCVHRPPSPAFKKHNATLQKMRNPFWTSGRKWQIL